MSVKLTFAQNDGIRLDGTTYYFQTFKVMQGKRAGYTWSPPKKTKMRRLVEIVEDMAEMVIKKIEKGFLKYWRK